MSDLFQTGVRPIIDNFLLEESKKKRDYGEYWSASSAGYCQRKVIFERLGIPHVSTEDDARKQRVFTSGHIFHAWIQDLTKKAGISIAQEVELQDEDLMIRGHFDDLILVGKPSTDIRPIDTVRGGITEGYYEITKQPQDFNILDNSHLILYDYKTRNSRNFSFAKTPSYFHRLQLGTYMYMIRTREIAFDSGMSSPNAAVGGKNLTEARTLNIEKDTLRMAEVRYLWDDKLEKDVVDYWTSLNKHWGARTLPSCTCADHENGFMAKEKFNPYFRDGEPCSIKVYQEWRAKQKVEDTT